MTNIEELMKCPECLLEGHFEIVVRKKEVVAYCDNCNYSVRDRVPYPKHRVDEEGYQYPYKIGNVRPNYARDEDSVTCSQSEWEERKC